MTGPHISPTQRIGIGARHNLIVLRLLWRSSKTGDADAKDYLSLTLEAGAKLDLRNYMECAIAFVRNAPELRMGALTALSRIESGTAIDLARKALASLGELVVSETDDLIRTHILAATLGLYAQSPKSCTRRPWF